MRFAAIVVIALMAVSPVMANLLVNGGFETGLTGWTSVGKAAELNSGIWGPGGPAEGANYASIQTGGGITGLNLTYQTVTIPAGTPALAVSGWWAAGEVNETADHGIWLFDGAGLGGTVLASDYATISGSAGSGWAEMDSVVPAPGGGFDGDQVTVAFGWQNGSGGWSNGTATHADAFDVTAVPEPVTMSLLGLAGLALLRRRR